MSHNGDILIAALRRRFRYEPRTGKLYYRVDTRKFNAGDVAGNCQDANGYLLVYVAELERTVLVHSVCFAIAHGHWPKLVDHANGNVQDNRYRNLREATNQTNAMNAKVKAGSSHYRGVIRKRIRWNARIVHNGVQHDLGIYDSEEDAALAYNRKATELFGEYARLNAVRDNGRNIQRRPARY